MTLIDTAMAAVVLQSSERRVRRLVERGVLVNHGTPRKMRVDLDQINQRIREGKIEPATRQRHAGT